MCNFRVGQKVAAIRSEWYDIDGVAQPASYDPREGCVYTIQEVECIGDDVFLYLAEVGYFDGYHASGFRPVVERGTETGMSILRDILNKTDKPVEVVA